MTFWLRSWLADIVSLFYSWWWPIPLLQIVDSCTYLSTCVLLSHVGTTVLLLQVTYVVNRNINYTNVCGYRCQFCAFRLGSWSSLTTLHRCLWLNWTAVQDSTDIYVHVFMYIGNLCCRNARCIGVPYDALFCLLILFFHLLSCLLVLSTGTLCRE
jgi:hypothetical protein